MVIRILLIILEKYGLQIANICLLGFVSWKLANNHLKHIANSIKENSTKLTGLDKKLDDVVERVARLEGRTE